MYLTLEAIKRHLNIDLDFHGVNGNEEDVYLLDLATVAERTVERSIDHPLSHHVHPETALLEAPLLHAMLLLIGTWYANRESTTSQYTAAELPHGYQMLINLYKDYYCPSLDKIEYR